MNYMTCTSCKGVVSVNNTGTCLRCQMGFTQTPQGDEINAPDEVQKVQKAAPPKKRRAGPKKRKPTKREP